MAVIEEEKDMSFKFDNLGSKVIVMEEEMNNWIQLI